MARLLRPDGEKASRRETVADDGSNLALSRTAGVRERRFRSSGTFWRIPAPLSGEQGTGQSVACKCPKNTYDCPKTALDGLAEDPQR